MNRDEIADLVRILEVLASTAEGAIPAGVDGASYSAGFQNGKRSAYIDVVNRLRELRSAVPA